EPLLQTGEHWAEAVVHNDSLLTRAFNGVVTLWKLSTKDQSKLFAPTERPTTYWRDDAESLAFRGPNALLYPEGGERFVVRIGGTSTTIDLGIQIVTARFIPEQDAVAAIRLTTWLQLWSIGDGKLLRTFPCTSGVGDFDFSPDGSLLAIGEIGNGGG